MSSGTNEQFRNMMEAYDQSSDGVWRESSDPSLDGCIFGLADPDKYFQNPFQLTDDIRSELFKRTEGNGAKALEWSLGSFYRVGGNNTLRSIWAKLKAKKRVRDSKRSASDSYGSEDSNKKIKTKLDLSSAHLDFESIDLCTTSSIGSTSVTRDISCDLSAIVLRDDPASNDQFVVSLSSNERVFDSSDDQSEIADCASIPDLASSEISLESDDSGRSDMAAASKGILGVRCVRKDDIETGKVTETSWLGEVVEGYETDDVKDYNSSRTSFNSPVTTPSYMTDEGVSLQEERNEFIDDSLVVRLSESDHEELDEYTCQARTDWLVVEIHASDSFEQVIHGMPGIAGTQGVVYMVWR